VRICEFQLVGLFGFVILIWMFSVPLMLAPLRVEIKPMSTFLVTFWTYGFSGNVSPLMSMLIRSLASRLIFMMGPMRLSIIFISFSGWFLMSINGICCVFGFA